MKRTKNEIKNKLEQLRALDNNMPINVILAKKQVIGVDTKEDYMELKKNKCQTLQNFNFKITNVRKKNLH